MLKKSMLLVLMILGVGFPLIGMQEAIIDVNNVRMEMIKNQEGHNQYLDSRDQWLKYCAILLPTAIVGATIWRGFKGNLNADLACLSFVGGIASGFFSIAMTQILSNVQEGRNKANTKLREELTEICSSKAIQNKS